MNPVARAALGVLGAVTVVVVFDAAIRTFLLPRVASVRLSRTIVRLLAAAFRWVAKRGRTYEEQDRRLSLFPPILLLCYQATWLAMLFFAYAFLFVAAGARGFSEGFALSGSSLLTLGTSAAHGSGELSISYVEAACGLTLLALLIAFIPTLYTAFQRRERSVSRLGVRAGVPATPWGIIEIAQSVGDLGRLDGLWREWESWFIELRETHTTLTMLSYYRTPIPGQNWIAAAASVLDSAALFNAAVDRPASPSAGLCIRSGWMALRGLADYFRITYPVEFDGTESVSVTRAEFDQALDHMVRSSVPVLPDREAAWLDFVGWRVNYDAIVEALHTRFYAPRLDWTSVLTRPPTEPSNVRGAHPKHPGGLTRGGPAS